MRALKQNAQVKGLPDIHLPPLDAQILETIVAASGIKLAVEIGVLAGYSALRILRGIQPGGKLYAFEKSEKNAQIARENWQQFGISEQVDLRVGDAKILLPEINHLGPFDLVFIDADKASYPDYFYWAKQNLRPGGVLLADNCFAFGLLWSQKEMSASERDISNAIGNFNHLVASDPEFRTAMIPTGEGMLFAVKTGKC